MKGGTVRGEQVELAPRTLHEDRDVPVLNEYRDVLGGIYKRMYGLDREALTRIFPKATAKDLGLF